MMKGSFKVVSNVIILNLFIGLLLFFLYPAGVPYYKNILLFVSQGLLKLFIPIAIIGLIFSFVSFLKLGKESDSKDGLQNPQAKLKITTNIITPFLIDGLILLIIIGAYIPYLLISIRF